MTPRSPLRLAVVCVLVVVSGPLLGAEKARTCTVKVVDANGAPLTGVAVEAFAFEVDLWRSAQKARSFAKGITTADGRFSFEAVASDLRGLLVVLAHKKGLGMDWGNLEPRVGNKLTLTLTKGVVLSGTVVDSAGKPVAGAEVRPMLFFYAQMRWLPAISPIDLLVARTDAKGRFRFEGVPKTARAEFTVIAKGKAKTFTFKSRMPQFAVGQKDIRLTIADEAKVSGSVVDKAGRLVAGARVTVRTAGPRRPFFFDEVVTGADGTFTIGCLPAGKLTAIIVGPKSGLGKWVRTGAEVETVAGKTVAGVKLTVISGGVLEVSVRDANTGAPLGGARVRPQRERDSAPSFPPGILGYTGKDGIVRIRLAPGKYIKLWIMGNGPYEGFWGWGNEPFEIADGKTRKVQVKLKPLAVLKGVVRDPAGKSAGGAEVVVLPPTLAWPFYGLTIEADGKGLFEVRLRPRERQGRGPVGTVIARIAARNLIGATEIGDGNALVEIKLASGAQITGLVTDPKGKAIAGAQVLVLLKVGGRWTFAHWLTAVTDGKGRYTFAAMLPDVKYQIRISADGYGRAKVMGDIPANPKAPVHVEKVVVQPTNLSISGVVIDPDGDPAVGVLVIASGEGQPDSGKLATTDKKGKFKIVKLCKGQVRLYVGGLWGPGAASAAAGDTDVEIQLEHPRSNRPTKRPPPTVPKGEEF